MKKWISFLTCIACIFSSVRADEAPPVPQENTTMDVPPELDDETDALPQDDGKKPVGQAASDGSKSSGVGKYVLAGCAIALGIAALILVSKNHGHKK
jgi:hypothetical protein